MKGKEEEEHRVWMRLYSGTRGRRDISLRIDFVSSIKSGIESEPREGESSR